MKQQTKDIIWLLVMILPFCIGLYFAWFHTPMYKDTIAEQREWAGDYLRQNYYFPDGQISKEAMIRHYGFADEEVNPEKILEHWMESRK